MINNWCGRRKGLQELQGLTGVGVVVIVILFNPRGPGLVLDKMLVLNFLQLDHLIVSRITGGLVVVVVVLGVASLFFPSMPSGRCVAMIFKAATLLLSRRRLFFPGIQHICKPTSQSDRTLFSQLSDTHPIISALRLLLA
jgi:hypothetical protein